MANVGDFSYSAHVADDPEHHLLRKLLCGGEPERCELRGFGLRSRIWDENDERFAYVCVTVTEARVNVNDDHYIINFDDAHISIANIRNVGSRGWNRTLKQHHWDMPALGTNP